MSSFLLLPQCPACLVCLICMILKISHLYLGGRTAAVLCDVAFRI